MSNFNYTQLKMWGGPVSIYISSFISPIWNCFDLRQRQTIKFLFRHERSLRQQNRLNFNNPSTKRVLLE